ncbi:hypothetical protein E1A91_A06G053800v1 [Gossypium mustelinum]|uniref:Uncharacterized protein n=2 Tax=Gossypium TaxID=3633 RepID=A0A5D2YTD7_GOSMU|nr:hypothetical protein ES332_A06G058500v1 [Gossypium tomentosum]TYJ29189.1 hypothetical protein E1A91_A06G053800v1 [Gossypium mustelinum]
MGPLRSFCLPRPRSGAQSLKKRPLKLQELKEASSSQKKKKKETGTAGDVEQCVRGELAAVRRLDCGAPRVT